MLNLNTSYVYGSKYHSRSPWGTGNILSHEYWWQNGDHLYYLSCFYFMTIHCNDPCFVQTDKEIAQWLFAQYKWIHTNGTRLYTFVLFLSMCLLCHWLNLHDMSTTHLTLPLSARTRKPHIPIHENTTSYFFFPF